MRRFLVIAVCATAAVLYMASPALAHEEISPSTFPTGKPTFFTLTAANEKKADLTRITVTVASGVPLGATTHQPPGWTPQKSETHITWSGGSVAPDNFEQWGFEIEGADQPGTLQFQVSMGFADGSTSDAGVDVTAVAPGAPATTVAPAPAAKSSSGDGLAVAALIAALLAGLLAGVALVASLRGRARPRAVTEGQDW